MIKNKPVINTFSPFTLTCARNHPFDPPADLMDLSQSGSVHRLVYPDGHLGWLVTGHATVRKVLTDDRFSARSEYKRAPVCRPGIDPFYGSPALPGWLVDMDPPEHTRLRRALSHLLCMRRIKEMAPRIEQIVQQQLDIMEKMTPAVDLVEHFALPVPSMMICELLGVPYEHRREFQQNSAALFSLDVSAAEAEQSMDYLTHFLLSLVQQKRHQSSEDLLSELIQQNEFTDEELAGVGVLLLTAGHETTTSMLALGTFALLTHPSQRAALQSDATLIDNAVEELLRYLTIFQFGVPRTPLEDVELEGHLIKAGESVTLSLPTANRDPAQFTSANTLDIQQPVHGHFAFGYGVHYCLGMHLARIEMRIGYTALFNRFPTLRLAVPPETIKLNTNAGLYGIHHLPVTW